jgi:putative oxidoreductase
VHWPNGLWGQENGFEYPLVVLVLALVIAAVGPGYYSLDRVLRFSLPEPATFWVGLVVVFLVSGAVLVLPRSRPLSTANVSH